jgi:hypothetical protein
MPVINAQGAIKLNDPVLSDMALGIIRPKHEAELKIGTM